MKFLLAVLCLLVAGFCIAPSAHAQQWVCDGHGCRIVRSAPAYQPAYQQPAVTQVYAAPAYYAPQPAVQFGFYAGPAMYQPRTVVRNYYGQPIYVGRHCGCANCRCWPTCRCGR